MAQQQQPDMGGFGGFGDEGGNPFEGYGDEEEETENPGEEEETENPFDKYEEDETEDEETEEDSEEDEEKEKSETNIFVKAFENFLKQEEQTLNVD